MEVKTMELIWNIFLKSVEIFILISGTLGMILSFLLMLSPGRTQTLSQRFNYWINFDEKLAFLDTNYKTDDFICRHHLACGVMMLAGSAFFLIFLLFKLDMGQLLDLFFGKGRLLPINEIIISAAVVIGKLSGLVGIVLGFFLLFASGKIKGIDDKMAVGLTMQPFINKLNEFHGGIDAIFLRYPVVLGLAGLAASVVLLLVSSIFLFQP